METWLFVILDYYRPRTWYEGRLCFDTCLSGDDSICPHLGGGGYPSQVQVGGVLRPGPAGGGVPQQGGIPPQVPPLLTWLGGTLMGGTPMGIPTGGTPTGGYPPHWTWLGGTLTGGTPPWVPPSPGQTWPGWSTLTGGGGGVTPSRVVLDTPRSVCLLCSRWRTFLFLYEPKIT